MSNPSPKPGRPRNPISVEIVTDPAEIAAAEERYRQSKKTALWKIGCEMVVDAPLDLLAQYIAELAADDQEMFLNELLDRLPPAALTALDEALKRRLGRGAA